MDAHATLEAGTVAADRCRVEALPTTSPEVLARFEREAIAAAIDHPNVARATDFGRLPDGAFFLVLPWLVSRALAHPQASRGGFFSVSEHIRG
jgi:hypothetical protein